MVGLQAGSILAVCVLGAFFGILGEQVDYRLLLWNSRFSASRY